MEQEFKETKRCIGSFWAIQPCLPNKRPLSGFEPSSKWIAHVSVFNGACSHGWMFCLLAGRASMLSHSLVKGAEGKATLISALDWVVSPAVHHVRPTPER